MDKKNSEKVSQKMQRRAEARRKKQRRILIIGGIMLLIILAAIGFMLWSNGTNAQPSPAGFLPSEVYSQQACQTLGAGTFLPNVHTQEKWHTYHGAGAAPSPAFFVDICFYRVIKCSPHRGA
jgi:cytoskeletal protein RodZ